ncbi:unnamed protein product [Schistosoma curassoni]|uniref:AAA_lid_3 domain-containing protein n=1 Tax=Schistosoma curassoni TaxID=6186 RepID=A0A183KLB7_9TREM|nr:unnamed protein product [Schistosoma curassoni]
MLDDKAAVDFLGEPRIRSGRCGKQIANAMALNLNNRLHFATGLEAFEDSLKYHIPGLSEDSLRLALKDIAGKDDLQKVSSRPNNFPTLLSRTTPP